VLQHASKGPTVAASVRVLQTPLRYFPRGRKPTRTAMRNKVLKGQPVFAAGERRAADSARHLLVDRLCSRVDFDDLVECVTVPTIEMNCRGSDHGAAQCRTGAATARPGTALAPPPRAPASTVTATRRKTAKNAGRSGEPIRRQTRPTASPKGLS
jgi:hypothetical protein